MLGLIVRAVRWRGWVAVVLAVALVGMAASAKAARARSKRAQASGPTAPAGPAPAWITINAVNGEVLGSEDPDRLGAPASMTKMMLALLVVEAVRDGQLKLSDPVTTSALASKMGGSQVYLKQGETFSVDEMLGALLVGSANDAAVALAERLAGSVPGAVDRMNERARELKLTATKFASVHGLPPSAGQTGDVTTPKDMARLAQELVKMPDVLRWTSTPEAPFRGGEFIMRNVNKLIGRFPGADGIKTGHFHQAGYNLTATAKRGDLRIITVVMGAPTNAARFLEAARHLEDGFAKYIKVTVVKGGTPAGTAILLPRARAAFQPITQGPVELLVKREDRDGIQTSVELQPGLRAPLAKGQQVGTLVVRAAGRELARVPVVTPGEVQRSTFWWVTPWR
ncbi:MAG TPA: D-alanyl-D-alanine carboxypeptidase family protein [Candidatus Sulfotelmatobacter sp.]|nr:D-alanyl-D-alanine carboxypeptidase family protein [Candidatus Sulfotelmatobacter sp.]